MEPIDVMQRLGRWSTGRGPLYLLLATRLRRLIDEGELPPGALLPPERVFAKMLAVGRSTVTAAYVLLESEGRIVRRQGSGTRVAGAVAAPAPDTTSAPMFLHLLEPDTGVISLACAAPQTPPAEVAAALTAIVPELAVVGIGYHPAGHASLRVAIAERYTRLGAPTSPDQILVTSGGQQALSLLARAFVRPGDRVLVEAPTYPGALEAFREESAVLATLPVGFAGFEAAVRVQRPAFAYFTPTFQNPTGTVLSRLHRQRVAELSAMADTMLIADEVLADLGFPGEAVPPLAADADGVVSVGSLSKCVWGGLRVGWIRASVPIIERLTRLRAVHDLCGSVPAQLAAARLLPDLDRLCRSAAAARESRHDALLSALADRLPEWTVPPVRGGQTLWARLPYGDGDSFAQMALRHGVAVLAGSGLDASGGSADQVRLHFRHSAEEATIAVARLAAAWRDYHPPERVTRSPAQLAV